MRFYEDLAWVFRLTSPPEDYEHESEVFAEMLRRHARIPVRAILNLGCGAGHHDKSLKMKFDVTGADISDEMLKLARELNPDVSYVSGDMRTLRLDEKFDAVTIFDSIDYMCTPEELRQAFDTAFAHLKPGGVFLTIPDEMAETFKQNLTQTDHGENDKTAVTFIENGYDPDPRDTTVEATFVMLIRRNGKLIIETESLMLGLFPRKTWLDCLEKAGFLPLQEIYADENGREYPVFVGVKERN
ncbi:MAG: class I SAM-dependent methyltransferase [bacterium]|nr:class I SAM-dependent methyltransferase [bacterium]